MKLPKIEKGEVRYEIYRDSFGEFRFRCRSANGQVLCASEGYKRKVSAIKTAGLLAEANSTCIDLTRVGLREGEEITEVW